MFFSRNLLQVFIVIIVLIFAQCGKSGGSPGNITDDTNDVPSNNESVFKNYKSSYIENIGENTFAGIDVVGNDELTLVAFGYTNGYNDLNIAATIFRNDEWSSPVDIADDENVKGGTEPYFKLVLNKSSKGAIVYRHKPADAYNPESFNVVYFNGVNWGNTIEIKGYITFRHHGIDRTPAICIDENGIVYVAYIKRDSNYKHFTAVSRFDESGLIDTYVFSDNDGEASSLGDLFIASNENNDIILLDRKSSEGSYTRIFSNGSWSAKKNVFSSASTTESISLILHNDLSAEILFLDNILKHYHFDGTEWSEAVELPTGQNGRGNRARIVFDNDKILVGYEHTNFDFIATCLFDGSKWNDKQIIPTGINNDPNSPLKTSADSPNLLSYDNYFISIYDINGVTYANYYVGGIWSANEMINSDFDLTWNSPVWMNKSKGLIFLVGDDTWEDPDTLYLKIYKFTPDLK